MYHSLKLSLFTFSDSWTRAHLEETACSKESRGETPDIQDGGGTRHFKNPEEKGNVLRCRRSKKSDHEKSLLFLLEYFLSSSLSSLYRSGLCRQKTFAWLSPEAVTATDASLKEDDVKKENQHSSVTEETFKTARERERDDCIKVVPVDGEVEDLCGVAAVLGHHAASASVPQAQRSV